MQKLEDLTPEKQAELSAKWKALYVENINKLIAKKEHNWDYIGDFGGNCVKNPDFAEELADKLVSIQWRIEPGWGYWLSVDPGWYRILADLDDALSAIAPNYTLHQVKSKFGTLRFYTGSIHLKNGSIVDEWDDESKTGLIIRQLVNYAELRSSIVCEFCGKWGKLIDCGWLYTICDDCAKEKDIEPKATAAGE